MLGTIIAKNKEELIKLIKAILGVNIIKLKEIKTVLILDNKILLNSNAKLINNNNNDNKILFNKITAIPNINKLKVKKVVIGSLTKVKLLIFSNKELVLSKLVKEEDIREV